MDRLQKSSETLTKATGMKCLPVQMDVRKVDLYVEKIKLRIKSLYVLVKVKGNRWFLFL